MKFRHWFFAFVVLVLLAAAAWPATVRVIERLGDFSPW